MPGPGGGYSGGGGNGWGGTYQDNRSLSDQGQTNSWGGGFESNTFGSTVTERSEVERCSRPLDMAGGETFYELTGVGHEWLRTDTVEAGMFKSSGLDSEIRDQRGDGDLPNATCVPVPNVDASCVNQEMEVGRDTGTYSPWNNCITTVNDVLEKCENNTCGPDGRSFHSDPDSQLRSPNASAPQGDTATCDSTNQCCPPANSSSGGDAGACNPANQSCPPDQPNRSDSRVPEPNSQSAQGDSSSCDPSNQSCPPEQSSQGAGGYCDPTTQSCPPDQSSQGGNAGDAAKEGNQPTNQATPNSDSNNGGIHDGPGTGGDSDCYMTDGPGHVTECGPSSVESSAPSGAESTSSDMSSGGVSSSDFSSSSPSDSSASSSTGSDSTSSSSSSDASV